MLNELAGQLSNGVTISNRAGWVRAVTARAKAGAFTPEAGIPIAERRKAILARPVWTPPAPPAPPIDESLAKVTDPILKAIMERIRRRHFEYAA